MKNSFPATISAEKNEHLLDASGRVLGLYYVAAVQSHCCLRKSQSMVKKGWLSIICTEHQVLAPNIILPFMKH